MTATSKGDPLLLLLATSADVFLAARCLRAPSPEVADARVERTTLASEYKSGIKNVRAKNPRFKSIYCVIFGFLDPRKHSFKLGNFDGFSRQLSLRQDLPNPINTVELALDRET